MSSRGVAFSVVSYLLLAVCASHERIDPAAAIPRTADAVFMNSRRLRYRVSVVISDEAISKARLMSISKTSSDDAKGIVSEKENAGQGVTAVAAVCERRISGAHRPPLQ